MMNWIARADARRPMLLPLGLLAGGTLFRIALVTAAHQPRWATAEISQTAIAYAKTGSIADAYIAGQGPTAHVNPITPAFAGSVYRLLGIRSDAAEAVLAGSAIAVAMLSFLAFYIFFGRLGTPRWARLLGLAACCFLPLYQGMETSEFRIWEGGLSVLLAISYLLVLVAVETRGKYPSPLTIGAMALLAALTFFLSPSLGLAIYAASGLWAVSQMPLRRWPVTIIIVVATLAIVLTPWALRNARQLGSPVLLRSNFGLELAMGYDPHALNSPDRTKQFAIRQNEIHPFGNPKVFAKMQSLGGEIAYSRHLGTQTTDWMQEHPGQAVKLTAEHLLGYWFPPQWQLALYYNPSRLNFLRQALLWLVSLAGLAGAILAVFRRQRRWIYPVLFIAAPTALYAVTQPIIRYHYLIFAMSIFLGVDFVSAVLKRFRPPLRS